MSGDGDVQHEGRLGNVALRHDIPDGQPPCWWRGSASRVQRRRDVDYTCVQIHHSSGRFLRVLRYAKCGCVRFWRSSNDGRVAGA